MLAAMAAAAVSAALATGASAAAPEYGRCLKVTTGTGGYGTAACTSAGGKRTYEWYPAFESAKPLVNTHFTTSIKEKTLLKLSSESFRMECTGETGSGEYSGNKTIANVRMTFTGCFLADGPLKCTSSGSATGEVVTTALHGELGIIKSSAEGPVKNAIGTDLQPQPGEPVATYGCESVGTIPTTVIGAVIGEVHRNTMVTKALVNYVGSGEVQKPMRFEGGVEETLLLKESEEVTQPFKHAALKLGLNQLSEEKVEVNSVF
jgi:hypothetical protein